MINVTDAYKRAIVADSRQMVMRAIVEIIDPNLVYSGGESSGEAEAYSNIDSIYNKDTNIDSGYASLELNRWMLNGGFSLDTGENAGFVSEEICDVEGRFSTPQWVELQFTGVSILQACSVYFPLSEYDGIPLDFTVEIKQGGTAYHTEEYTNNSSTQIDVKEFTVYNPDAIRVTVTRWSLPYRRARVAEISPGIFEKWDGSMLASFSIKQQGDVSCVRLPYGTCTLKMDNSDRRFEPRNKTGVFKSIQEAQGVDIDIGTMIDETPEYVKAGVFYQHSGGWKTSDNGLTMQWDLVDIIGLISDKSYIPPDTLPTTLEGWVKSFVAQLGVSFTNRYTVDPDYAELTVTAEKEDVSGKNMGDLLRYACMVTGTWARADAETGFLAVEPRWDEGNKITLANLVRYPVMKANEVISAIIFTLYDGNSTKFAVSGNTTASSQTVSVDNPFIHTEAEALTAARGILAAYGGNKIEITGRGDPASEIGDVDTVWLDESNATTARRVMQELTFSDGIMKNLSSELLQADGSFLYQEREVITEDGAWTVPDGVSAIRVIIVGGGASGTNGTDGTWNRDGEDGEDGLGAKVWANTINVNAGQKFNVVIGEGGATTSEPGSTMFGEYTSAQGSYFAYGYTDIASGDSFARTGVSNPLKGSGDGGKKGTAGKQGQRHTEKWTDEGQEMEITIVDSYPTDGTQGVEGASGCVVIYYDKE